MTIEGFRHLQGALTIVGQRALYAEVCNVIKQAPLYKARMPRTGKELRVEQTNCGHLGWYSDETAGYHYRENHPHTGLPWPAMPSRVLGILALLELPKSFQPQACLINRYREQTVLGMHRDADEEATGAPIIMFSLGDHAVFTIGGLDRKDPTEDVLVRSGDIVIMGGKSRMAWHGVKQIVPCTGRIFPRGEGGRIALTVRQVRNQPINPRLP